MRASASLLEFVEWAGSCCVESEHHFTHGQINDSQDPHPFAKGAKGWATRFPFAKDAKGWATRLSSSYFFAISCPQRRGERCSRAGPG